MNISALASNLSFIAILGLCIPVGCGSKQNGDGAGDTETAGASSGDTSGDTSGDVTGVPTGGTTDDTTTGGPTTGTTTTDGSATGGTTSDDPATGGAPMTEATTADPSGTSGTSGGGVLPDGADCAESAECMSGHCYVVPSFGGRCGECEGDADCAGTTMGGCTPPNPSGATGPTCNMGEAGGGCQTSDVCMEGLACGTVFNILGLIKVDTCGECTSTEDCAGGTICAPLFNVAGFTGVNECIEPGTLKQHAYCLLDGNGDEACMSGICSTVDIMGLATIGACGECNTDADCDGGETCAPGELNLGAGTATGSLCV